MYIFLTRQRRKSIICLMTDVRDRKNILEEFRKKEVERCRRSNMRCGRQKNLKI